MAEDIAELAVRVTPEGVEETTQQLRDQREEFQESADSVGESTNRLEAFSKRWRGAATVFALAFGTMAAAVLQRVPAFDEASSLFDIALTSMGLRLDELTRGPMGDFREEIRETIREVNEAEDPLVGLAKGVVGLADAILELGEVPFEAIFRPILGLERGENLLDKHIIPAFEALPDIVASQFAAAKNRVITEFINPLIAEINKLIQKANQLPGVDMGTLGTVQTTHPSGTPSAIGERRQDPDVIDRITTGRVETSLEIDGRKVGEATKPFTVRGVLSKRGLPGE